MQFFARKRCAFTLIEMVVVLAVMGIALAVAAPSMILPRRTTDIGTIVAEARNAALRRSEQMTLAVASDGTWSIFAARSSATPLRYGKFDSPDGSPLRIDISPLGLCTVNEMSAMNHESLDPFTCTFTSARVDAK